MIFAGVFSSAQYCLNCKKIVRKEELVCSHGKKINECNINNCEANKKEKK